MLDRIRYRYTVLLDVEGHDLESREINGKQPLEQSALTLWGFFMLNNRTHFHVRSVGLIELLCKCQIPVARVAAWVFLPQVKATEQTKESSVSRVAFQVFRSEM